MAQTCPNRGPGRYEGEARPCITSALDSFAGVGTADEEVGSTQELGHAALFRGPIRAFEVGQTLRDSEGPCQACLDALPGNAGAILFTDTVGFLSAYLAPTAALLEEAWAGYVSDLEGDLRQEA